jgi:hypothetical protein
MAFRQIKTPAIADQSVIETKLGVDAIKQQVAAETGTTADLLLIYSNSGDNLRKISLNGLINTYSTDNLSEGSNLYFTDARAKAAVAQDIADAVAAEATIREAADNTLDAAISAEVARATAAEQANADAIAAETTRATGVEAQLRTDFEAADTNLQTQINNIISNVDPVALDSLTEIVNAFQSADDTLTAGINANATAIANETTARSGADTALNTRVDGVQSELDATQAAAGLAADGSFVAHSGTNYIDSATSMKGVDAALDAAIKVVADALVTETAATDGEVTALQAADVTLQGNIDDVAADLATEAATARAAEEANANAIQDEINARVLADTNVRTDFGNADAAIQAELDATQTGAGLAANGAYVAPTTSNYHDAATSLSDADMKIDAALKAEANRAVAAEGVLQGNIDSEAATREAADTALDGRVTTVEGEMDSAEARLDALEAGTGGEFTLDTVDQTLPGGINELHTELDATVARVTTNEADIATNAAAIANIISNTDPASLDSLTEIVAAFQAADSSLLGTINANTTAINNEVTRATGAEATLQTNIDNEATARQNADTTLQNNIDTEATTRQNADTLATGDRALIRQEFASADSDLQAELDATQTGAGLAADGGYAADATTTYLTAATDLKDADKKLDAAIKANADALAAEIATTDGEVTALQGRMDAEEAATAAATLDRAAIRSEFAAADALLAEGNSTVQAELDATQTGAGLDADGGYTANASSNYITTATSLKDADNKLDTKLRTVELDLASEISRATNRENAIETAYQTADSTLQTNIDNEATARAAADTIHTANISTNTSDIADLRADLTTETSARQTADSALQTELDNTQLGSGLGTDGSYTADATTNYITGATSLKNADKLLDAELKVHADRIDAILAGSSESLDQFVEVVAAFEAADSNINNAITTLASDAATARSTLQTNLEAADDALDGRLTTAETDIDELDALTGIDGGVALTTTAQDLIGAINEVNQATGGNFAAFATEVDNIEAALGLAGDGTFVAHSGSNYMDAATTAKGAREALDAALKAEADRAVAAEGVNAAAIVSGDNTVRGEFAAADTSIRTDFAAADLAIQQELDTTQTGAGLEANGQYAANAGANYIGSATSLKDADNKLDAALKTEETARIAADGVLQTNIDNEATTRANADTTLQGNIDAEAATRAAADTAHSNSITALETEMTATQTAAGLNADGTYTANASANYIAAATSLQDADNKLDAAIKVNADGLATEVTARITAVTNEKNRAEAEEARIEALINSSNTSNTAVTDALAQSIQDNADNLAQEILDRAAGDTTLQGNIDTLEATVNNIISNTDPAALDSLTEIVTAFQNADSTLTGAVAANSADILAETNARIAADDALGVRIDNAITAYEAADTAATSDRAAIRSEFANADATLQTNIDGKLSLTGGTMSGAIEMSTNKITGLAPGSDLSDAVNKQQLDAVANSLSLSNFDTDDVTEGSTNLYFTDARVRAAVSATGDLNYDSATGVFSVDTSKALTELTDYKGGTDFTQMKNYILQVNDTMDGVELVDPASVAFQTVRRQTIDGDGTQTTFALDFATSQSDAMVFVGGVIQDPVSHYTIDSANQTLTFVQALPLGTQAVVIANPVASIPFIEEGTVTKDKLSADVKAYTQKLGVSASTTGTVVDTFDGTAYRTGKYIIQVDNGAGEYETREALVVHDGTNAYITEFAIVYTGSGLLGDATVQVNGSNVELIYTANAAGATVKVISTYIDV